MNKLTNLLEEVADVLFTIGLIIACLITFVCIIPFLLIVNLSTLSNIVLDKPVV